MIALERTDQGRRRGGGRWGAAEMSGREREVGQINNYEKGNLFLPKYHKQRSRKEEKTRINKKRKTKFFKSQDSKNKKQDRRNIS